MAPGAAAREHLVDELGRHKLGRAPVLGAGLGLDDGDVYVLALAAAGLAGEEGGHSRRGPDEARLSQGDVAAVLDRLPLRQPQASQIAAHPVKHNLAGLVVAVRPRLPKVGDGDENNAGVRPLQVCVGQAKGGHDPWGKVLHHHVHTLDKLQENGAGRGGLEVEGDAALVGVQMQEEAAFLRVRHIVREGAHAPGEVAAVRPLHLDYVCAVVGQHLCAVRPGYVPGQVQDAHVGKRHVRHKATSGCPCECWRLGLGIVELL